MRLAVRRESRAVHHPDWIWELKYDGFRALLRVENGRAELISRRKNVYESFAPLCTDLARRLRDTTGSWTVRSSAWMGLENRSSTISRAGAARPVSSRSICCGSMAAISGRCP
jgi:hypothetical protein